MHEIKFRGQCVESDEWVYGYYLYGAIKDEHIIWTDNENWRVDPETVGQYTGLKDRNGKEIYEGDILKITYTDWPPYIGQVTWQAEQDYPAYDLVPWIDCGMNALSWIMSESDPSVVSYEVIGNIYENPELLGGTEA